jgi:hypothetical protein
MKLSWEMTVTTLLDSSGARLSAMMWVCWGERWREREERGEKIVDGKEYVNKQKQVSYNNGMSASGTKPCHPHMSHETLFIYRLNLRRQTEVSKIQYRKPIGAAVSLLGLFR